MNQSLSVLAAVLLIALSHGACADEALSQLLTLSPEQAARQVLTPQERAVLDALERSNATKGPKAAATRPVVTGPNEVRFIYGASRPTVVCSLLHVCDIALEPGENVLDLKIGDGARWLIERSVSGHEGAIVEHIALKPTDIGLNTNLRIYTDKRTYYLDLKSTAQEFMPQVAFIYPEATLERYHQIKDQLTRAQQAHAFAAGPGKAHAFAAGPGKAQSSGAATVGAGAAGTLLLEQLNFNYELSGDEELYPLRVFNDGRQTFVQMPTKLMATGSSFPALVVVNEGGNAMGSGSDSGMGLINYRVSGSSFVVDGIPRHLRLLLGSSADSSALRADIELTQLEP